MLDIDELIQSNEIKLLITNLFRGGDLDSFDNEIDNSALLDFIAYHRLENKYKSLPFFSIEQQNRLDFYSQSSKNINLLITRELFLLQQFFLDNSIDFIVLKGVLLSHKMYGNFTERSVVDLDVLVKEYQVDEIKKKLVSLGYIVEGIDYQSPKQKEYLFRNLHHINFISPSGVSIELHWKLFASNLISNEFQNNCWLRRKEYIIQGKSFFVLDEVDEFVFLSIHGFRHYWAKLFWINDVNFFYRKYGVEFLNKVIERAIKYELLPYIIHTYILLEAVTKEEIITNELFSLKKYVRYKKSVQLMVLQFKNRKSITNEKKIGEQFKLYIFHYKNIFLISGIKGVLKEIINRRNNPSNWSFFVFGDRLFFLNHVFSRTIWMIKRLKR